MRKIRLNGRQFKGLVTESVRRVLNEISDDTIFNADYKAQKYLDKEMWNPKTRDNKLFDRRKRQKRAFRDELNRRAEVRRNAEGKQVYYFLPTDCYGQPNGLVQTIELTKDEFLDLKKKGCYIYDNEYDADVRAQD